MRCLKKTRSGAVCEIEVYSVPDSVKLARNTEPKPVNVRTDEEKARYNRHKSEKHFVRLVNTNFTSAAYYVTLTYDNKHLPESYPEAVKNLDNYIRRLRYSNPHAKIIAVTGFGSRSGRLHHHLIVSGVSEGDILNKWTFGEIAKVEHLHGNKYGEDFTALAVYLHKHAPAEHKGKRWKQTKNIQQPMQEKAKEAKTPYSENRPPQTTDGYALVEVKTCEFFNGYICFKYVRKPCEPLNVQPNFARHKQLSECQRL